MQGLAAKNQVKRLYAGRVEKAQGIWYRVHAAPASPASIGRRRKCPMLRSVPYCKSLPEMFCSRRLIALILLVNRPQPGDFHPLLASAFFVTHEVERMCILGVMNDPLRG